MLTSLKNLLASFWSTKPRRMHSQNPDNQAYISELTFAGVISSEMAVMLKRHPKSGEYWIQQSVHDFKERQYEELDAATARSIVEDPAKLVDHVSHSQELKALFIASLETNVLTRHLRSLETHFLYWHMPTRDNLQPGLSPGVIESAFNAINLVPTLELQELYAWRNGTDRDKDTLFRDIELIPGFYLLSIEDAIAHLKNLEDKGIDVRNLFPLLANAAGDFYAADLSELSEHNASGKIVKYTLSNSGSDVVYESLELMMHTIVSCCNEGIITGDKDGLVVNAAKHAVVAQRINPNLVYWNNLDLA